MLTVARIDMIFRRRSLEVTAKYTTRLMTSLFHATPKKVYSFIY